MNVWVIKQNLTKKQGRICEGVPSKFLRSVGTWTTLAVLLVVRKQSRSFSEVVILLHSSGVSSMGMVKIFLQQRNSWRRCSCPSPTPSCSWTPATPLLNFTTMSPMFSFGTLPNSRTLKRAIARTPQLKLEGGATREGN